MEFIKVGKNYMIKNSNGRIVSEKEKLELETKQLQLENESCGCACPEKIKKINKNKKKIKEIDNEYEKLLKKKKIELFNKDLEKITALQDKENADDTIKETDTII
jgi:hypothetical protein